MGPGAGGGAASPGSSLLLCSDLELWGPPGGKGGTGRSGRLWSGSAPEGQEVGPLGSVGKESACQRRRHRRWGSNPWVGKMPWRRKWHPTPVFLPGDSHGFWWSLVSSGLQPGGVWWATVCRVTKSQTRLND